jgi:hypothetical protein
MHHIFGTRTFSQQEINDITAQEIAKFKRTTPQFHPCPANAEKLMNWIISQLGSNEGPDREYDYPYTLEAFQAAYYSILDSGQWFYLAPETTAEIQAREARERAAQQQAIDAENLRRQPELELAAVIQETTQLAKSLPMKDLRVVVANERPSSPNGSKFVLGAQPGSESRPIGMAPSFNSRLVDAKLLQEVRRKCAIDNPTIPRDSVRMNELVHREIKRQQQQ